MCVCAGVWLLNQTLHSHPAQLLTHVWSVAVLDEVEGRGLDNLVVEGKKKSAKMVDMLV